MFIQIAELKTLLDSALSINTTRRFEIQLFWRITSSEKATFRLNRQLQAQTVRSNGNSRRDVGLG